MAKQYVELELTKFLHSETASQEAMESKYKHKRRFQKWKLKEAAAKQKAKFPKIGNFFKKERVGDSQQ